MATLNLDDLQPGMTLAAPVKDRAGRVLLASGQEITDKALRIFRMWGVTEAEIEGVNADEAAAMRPADVDPEALHAAEVRAAELFRHCKLGNPVVRELFRLATIRAARKQGKNDDNSHQTA